MKTIKNEDMLFKGVPLLDEKGKQLTTLTLVCAVLENSPYTASSDIMKAVKIEGKLTEKNGNLVLDDADFDFIKTWSATYQPLLKMGMAFAQFYEQLEG